MVRYMAYRLGELSLSPLSLLSFPLPPPPFELSLSRLFQPVTQIVKSTTQQSPPYALPGTQQSPPQTIVLAICLALTSVYFNTMSILYALVGLMVRTATVRCNQVVTMETTSLQLQL